MISVFDMYKIGIGPSSSHTVGPDESRPAVPQRTAGAKTCLRAPPPSVPTFTARFPSPGRGHNTDIAILLGLMGYLPNSVPIEHIEPAIAAVKTDGRLTLNEAEPARSKTIAFDFKADMPFHRDSCRCTKTA